MIHFFYNKKTKEYFFQGPNGENRFYFTLDGYFNNKTTYSSFGYYKLFLNKGVLSKIDGPAEIYDHPFIKEKCFHINGKFKYEYEFAKETNHKLCNLCLNFCKQECFFKKG